MSFVVLLAGASLVQLVAKVQCQGAHSHGLERGKNRFKVRQKRLEINSNFKDSFNIFFSKLIPKMRMISFFFGCLVINSNFKIILILP